MPAENTVTVRIACRPCAGAGGHASGGAMFVSDWDECSACRGTGVAAERIVPACAEPFPLARPEDD